MDKLEDYKTLVSIIEKQQKEIDNLLLRVSVLEASETSRDIQKEEAKKREKYSSKVFSENWENESLNG